MDNMKDIESYFLKKEKEEQELKKENSKSAFVQDKNINKNMKKLEKEIINLRKRNSELELQIDSLSTEKYNNLSAKDNQEIADMFMDFNVEKYQDTKLLKQIDQLTEENKLLKNENKKLQKNKEKYEEDKKHRSFKKKSYDEIYKKIKLLYKNLSPQSLMSISTAEYLYLNEVSSQLDYSGAYVNYLKALEIELKRVYKLSSKKDTFGSLIKKLKQNTDFTTFVKRIEENKVTRMRNIAIHEKSISKNECGKIRKLLLQDNWLKRILFLIEESHKSGKNKEYFVKLYVKTKTGTLFYNKINYNRYSTNKEIDILSRKTNLSGFMSGIVKEVIINSETFYIY